MRLFGKATKKTNDIWTNGFDKSRPIIVTEAYIIVDGHSRFMAAKKAGLEKVPVIIKKFDSRDETIEYECKMQLNSRRLTDGEYFAAFLKLDEIRRYNPNAQGSSNTGKGINSVSFKLGVLFVLSEFEKGRKKSQILKDKRIAKLELCEVNLSEEDAARISQRFGIA